MIRSRKVMGPKSPGNPDTVFKPGHPPSNGRKKPDHLFKPGTTGNPQGGRIHARNKLNHEFLKDMLADWEMHGADAITTFRTERPNEYVKVVAGLLPRELNLKVNELDELTDHQLDQQLTAVLAELEAASAQIGAGTFVAKAPQPPAQLPTL